MVGKWLLLLFLITLQVILPAHAASWHRVSAKFAERESAGHEAVAACNAAEFAAVRRDLWGIIEKIREERLKPEHQGLSGSWDRLFIDSLNGYHQLRQDYGTFCDSAAKPTQTIQPESGVNFDCLQSEFAALMADIRLIQYGAAAPCLKKDKLAQLRQELDEKLQQLKQATDASKDAPVDERVRYYDLAFEALDLRNRMGQTLKSCP